MSAFLDKLLEKLGWNGKKTTRGILIFLVSIGFRYLGYGFADHEINLAMILLAEILINTSDFLNIFGISLAGIGAFHKIIKFLRPEEVVDSENGHAQNSPVVNEEFEEKHPPQW